MFLYVLHKKQFFAIIADILCIFFSYIIARSIIIYPETIYYSFLPLLKSLSVIAVLYILFYYAFQVYRILWRYASRSDYFKLFWANLLVTSVILFLSIVSYISFMKLELLTAFFLVIMTSVGWRMVAGHGVLSVRNRKIKNEKILIIGAGTAGRMIMSEYNRRKMGKAVVGFLDDDKSKRGKICNGKLVLGPAKKIREIINVYGVTSVIFAMPSVGQQYVKQVAAQIKQLDPGIIIQELPPITKIFDGVPLMPDLIDIGLADIGGREEFLLNIDFMEKVYNGAVVLITGAGGSIGSELCHQLLKFKIKTIVAVGRGENSIYNLARSLDELVEFFDVKPQVVYKICDVKNSQYLDYIFNTYTPQIVFHAAAHKHVPLMESNEVEALHNNVIGTKNVLDMCVKYSVKRFVLISTDKAVYPENVMGASKRVAELLTFYYCQRENMHMSVVRFGNVIGSRGSVIPLFQEQIKKGGPVTVTHPKMKRYFMTISEAALLVINAASLNDTGALYVLDMGRQYKIIDVARNLIKSYGLEMDRDIQIKYTGLRPGEKLDERLYYDYETVERTGNDKILTIEINTYLVPVEALKKLLYQLDSVNRIAFYQKDKKQIRELVQMVVPEFNRKGN